MLVLHGVVYPKTPVICADISCTRLGAMVHRGGDAIVIGASMGGLLAARALAEHYDRVTIIERDELPESPEPPKGVPQGRHPHALHARGARGSNSSSLASPMNLSRKGLSAPMVPRISSGSTAASTCATHRARSRCRASAAAFGGRKRIALGHCPGTRAC